MKAICLFNVVLVNVVMALSIGNASPIFAQSTTWEPSSTSAIDLGRKVSVSLPEDVSDTDVALEFGVAYYEQVEQTYNVCVPYTEYVEQVYSVKVPYTEEVSETVNDPNSGEEVTRTKSVTKHRTEVRTRTVPVTKTRLETRSRMVTVQRIRRESGAVPLDSIKFWTMAGKSVDTQEAKKQLEVGAACFLIYQAEDFAGDRFFAEMFNENVLVMQCDDDLAKETCTGSAAVASRLSLRNVARIYRQNGDPVFGLINYPVDEPKTRVNVPSSNVRIWSLDGKYLSSVEAEQAFSKTRRCVVVPYVGEGTFEQSRFADHAGAFAPDVYLVSILDQKANTSESAASVGGNKELPAEPIAHLNFDNNEIDPSPNDSTVFLKNASFKDGSLYVNGKYEHGLPPEAAKAVVAKISTPRLNYDAFTVAIRFKANEFEDRQRNIFTGGIYHRWFGLHRNDNGRLTVSLNNGDFQYATEFSLDPEKWYTVVCGVDAEARQIFINANGKKVANVRLPQDFEYIVATSDHNQTDKVWSFTNYSHAMVFHGLVDELLIFNEMLSPSEMKSLELGK